MPQKLSDVERELWRLAEQCQGVDGLLDFVPLVTPWYKRPEHLRSLAGVFHRAEFEGGIRALTSTPPQHGKTTSILHWMVRHLLLFPRHVVAYVSYEANFAFSKSKEARDIAERAGMKLADDAKSVREWRTEDGGGFLATGIGGPLTGHRVDLLVIDDPVKNRIVAESPAHQRNSIDWARSVALTRLPKDGSVIVNMARWSTNDLVGQLIDANPDMWEVINIPAVIDAGTENERALWPEEKPLEYLRDIKKVTHDYDWAALYEGRPVPRGGALFREPETWKAFDVLGARYAIACDPAASAKTSADHSAICVVAAVGSGVDQRAYVLWAWRGRVEIPELVQKLREVQSIWKAPIFVESAGGFKAVPQLLRRLGAEMNGKAKSPQLRVVEVQPIGDKYSRALGPAAAWNDGTLMVPAVREPWLPEFLAEIQRFTGRGDREDDQVDALSIGFTAVDRRAEGLVRGARSLPNPVQQRG